MCDPEGIKSFLYTFLQTKKRIAPEYTFIEKPVGRNKVRFLCEARADGYNYVGIGNSTTKKEAQTNAARDFVNYLVREGEIPASSVPTIQVCCMFVFKLTAWECNISGICKHIYI